ncbi:MAG: phosphopyruvate hydratase [Planctomycetia bacterium]|nr:phosphopyruvate hydratase [Planctomycetia bacterium]
MENKIKDLQAREILDSRGNPTIEVEVQLDNGIRATASVPSGASTGKYEACELRDVDSKKFGGKGVSQAVANVNDLLADELYDWNVFDQMGLDRLMIELDGTEEKERLGANAILATSIAISKAAAQASGFPLYRYWGGVCARILPVPMMNVLNGGAHADNDLDVQEFMIMPIGFNHFSDALRAGSEIFYSLKKLLKKRGYSINVGDEGGFAPTLKNNEEALVLLSEAVDQTSYALGKDIFFALDVASSELFQNGVYLFENQTLTAQQMVETLAQWVQKYPIISIEDGCAEDDWEGWKLLTETLGNRIQLVGDDLFVTNVDRIQQGIDQGIANGVLIKVNQIGTVTETIEAITLAQRNGYSTIVSHRSGETEDVYIADLAVGLNTGQIKTGSLSRSERTAKYNQLLRIEEQLGENAVYGGSIFDWNDNETSQAGQ